MVHFSPLPALPVTQLPSRASHSEATPPMGTASGFFGITYQGAVNGLASQTLSIFNMVRRA